MKQSTTQNLIDSGHTIQKNYNLWQNHKWVEGEWSPSKQWEIDTYAWFTKKYVKSFDSILEIGVGSGKWTSYLLQDLALNGKYVGVDITDIAIEMCNKKFVGFDNAHFIKNDGRTLPFLKFESIDFIWSYDVFVHISPHDVASYIREFARVMKKGAVAIIHHGRSHDTTGWRSTLTNKNVDDFLKANSLTLVDRVDIWGENGKYKVIHDDNFSIFRK